MFIYLDFFINDMEKGKIPEWMEKEKYVLVNIISPSYTGRGLFLGLGPEVPPIGDVEPVEPDILRVAHYMQKDKREIRIDTVSLEFVEVREGADECKKLTLDYSGAKGMSSEILTNGWEYNYYKTLLDKSIKIEKASQNL